MAKTSTVWGIDIGQCALKAMRCSRQGDKIVAEAVNYIEYPKISSQPDEADPKQMVREALDTFLSRNEVKGNKIAISVPGQSGLSRFFKPPPVDTKKIPDIVRFEARQQIPFALEEVIWDYQLLAGQEVNGFAVNAEVGLFAMKRDQVFKMIEPFTRADVELDIVQLSPLCIYNFINYDLLRDGNEVFDPDNPPPSVVVLALGTETTDLVVTNGFRVWQRSIPLGGNHFTKQLTKELKLTFAKAEHLKRNARQADDPKRVFQAMRPVFNDLVTEVQRSISYFQNIDRKAKIKGVVVLGNTVKLPGLQQYLSKNLGYEVIHFEQFHHLDETAVKSSPAFKENQLAFGVCYGLCLQGLDAGKLKTNLIPRELLVERMVRAEKPWAVASVAALLLACSFNFFFNYSAWYRVHEGRTVQGVAWTSAERSVDEVSQLSSGYEKADKERLDKKLLERIGNEVVGNADRRILWLELVTTLNAGLPRTPDVAPGTVPDPKVLPFDKRRELFIDKIETQYFPDMTTWYSDLAKRRYDETIRELGLAGDSSAGGGSGAAAAGAAGGQAGGGGSQGNAQNAAPTGEGWVIELSGYHFFNSDPTMYGPRHVYETIIRYLEQGVIALPNPKVEGQYVQFTMEEMGISHPILIQERLNRDFTIPNPNAQGSMMGGMMGGMLGPEQDDDEGTAGLLGAAGGVTQQPQNGGNANSNEPEEPRMFKAPRYDFVIQFAWKPVLLTDRLKAKEEAARKLAEAAAQQQAQQAQQQGGAAGPAAATPPAGAAPGAAPGTNPGAAPPAGPGAAPAPNPGINPPANPGMPVTNADPANAAGAVPGSRVAATPNN